MIIFRLQTNASQSLDLDYLKLDLKFIDLEQKYSNCVAENNDFKQKFEDFDFLPVWGLYLMAICTILLILSVVIGGVIRITSCRCSQKKIVSRRITPNGTHHIDMRLGKHAPMRKWISTNVTMKGPVIEQRLSDELFDEGIEATHDV